jgi:hypothetical protein
MFWFKRAAKRRHEIRNSRTYKITHRFEIDMGTGTMELGVDSHSTFDDNV